MKTISPIPKEKLAALVPQVAPFKFVDEILEVDENHIIGRYTFRKNETFYQGHFPDYPITPGAILLEAMVQVGLAAFGIYLSSLDPNTFNHEAIRTIFTDGTVEFYLPVFPGDQVEMRAEKIYFRKQKLRCKIEMFRQNNLVASCIVSGLGVPK